MNQPFWTLLLVWCTASCVDEAGRPAEMVPVPISDEGSGPVDCGAADGLSLVPIDDFESGAAAGTWYANNDRCEDCQAFADVLRDTDATTDETELATLQLSLCREVCEDSQVPSAFDKPLPADALTPSRCNSRFALRLTTVSLIDWGASIGNNFSTPVNAGGYEGIAFWARRASGSRGVIRVQIGEKHTDAAYDGPEGPSCTQDYDDDHVVLGCDGFGSAVNVSSNWELHLLPFAEMRQAGWGSPAPYMDTAGIRFITFLFPAGTWDIWIDDVAFYTREGGQ